MFAGLFTFLVIEHLEDALRGRNHPALRIQPLRDFQHFRGRQILDGFFDFEDGAHARIIIPPTVTRNYELAAGACASWDAGMSTAVLELKDKVERLTSEERQELMQILEDIEDNALADKAEAKGGWTKLADLKKEISRACLCC